MAGVKLSKHGYEILEVVMTELEMERPEVLRLAFAKGLTESEAIQEVKREHSDFEFPVSVIAKADEILLVKHLIIDKAQTQIDEKKLDRLILSCVEQGLEIMNQEIKQLSSADNYLLYLIQKHTV
ncbi:hypothetical protein CS060_12135 [Anoxybacillus flavithermus]|uniref:DUF1832 domain-containing protein n=1 Tax=Anoxybacillus flavithermus TaxID=33934 RepID=A0A2G5RML4_9BACL|nr:MULTISPECIES: hypothetical protein [Anoxybacillus]KFZ42264.1 hypothetical protein JS80_11065 [Anoxybacillus sp. KU2-6(11)]PIC03976.1 hypothetical protein CS060_12135 [Anoxybacillus flavithermus]